MDMHYISYLDYDSPSIPLVDSPLDTNTIIGIESTGFTFLWIYFA